MATFLTKPLINPSIVSRRAITAPSKLSWAGLRADFVKAGRKTKKPTHKFGDTIYSIYKTPNPEGQQKLFNLKQSTRSMFQRDKKIILANAPKKKSGIMNFFSRRDPKVKKEIKELKNTAKKNFREQEKKILQEADAADAVQYGIKQKEKAAKATVAAVPVATPKAAQVATVPAAPTTMFHSDLLSESFAGGARKRTRKNNNKKRNQKQSKSKSKYLSRK